MENKFNQYDQIYWAFTQLCNDSCLHCYNNSGPQGTRISEEECLAIVNNLPDGLKKLILSGGEPLAEKQKLYSILNRLKEKYDGNLDIALQFNGDLLNEKILQKLITLGVNHFSIASIDRYHKKQGARKETLSELFESQGIVLKAGQPELSRAERMKKKKQLTYGFFGATEDMWLGGNWARGRAMKEDIWMKDGTHNFCSIHSGAIGFMDNKEADVTQELSIQLWKVNPCCPGTVAPMGDARTEKIADIVNRMSKHEVMKKLNKGNIFAIGESIGIPEDYGRKRAKELKNVCLWCDEFFTRYYDIKTQKAKEKQPN
ncbi:radical SAM protein [Marivirga sp.]|uniref:radical SAM protein n=1 Tax=Marivirga sp. TaxID=2018662 RepID=UPI002D7F6346|nr:radical SAM protein [Marivirga sp.]HET8858396.1 radical SAM protein [Marivirga sp.]